MTSELLAAMQAIVNELPKTADGESIIPGMRVWLIERPTILGEEVLAVSAAGVHLIGKDRCYDPATLCSTFAAAKAAKEKQ